MRQLWLWLANLPRFPVVKKEGLQQAGQQYIVPLCGALLALGLWLSLVFPFGLKNDTGVLEVGKPSPVTIRAPRSATFVSETRTAAERTKAESRSENLVYQTDFTLPIEQRTEMKSMLDTITTIRADPTLNEKQKLSRIEDLSSTTVPLTGTLAEDIVGFNSEEWDRLRGRTLETYDQAVSEDSYVITEETQQVIRDRKLPYMVSQFPPEQRPIISLFVESFLRVNQTLDQQATQQRKREARESVNPQEVTVQAGENIVRAGDQVTAETIEKARAVGALPRRLNWVASIGMALLSIILSVAFMLFLLFIQRKFVRQPRPLLVIVGMIIVTAIAARMLYPLWTNQQYAFPLATAILVLTVIFDVQVALAGAVLLSIFIGILDSNTLSMTVTMLLGSATAVFVVRGADRPLTFLLAGVAVALATAISQFAFCLIKVGADCLQEVMTILAISGVNGGLSAILSLGLFNLIGYAAGIVTPLKMMELAHPAQPLLRKIIHEAPGTYYHSVAVANLAEAAANAVGADALLLRVAAYYHDIGKTLRPFFFTDNQTGRENVHNELDPHTSAEIIIDHVREGLKMAQAANLPQQIIDFIPTHHGTHVVSHFYQLALRQEDTVNIENFRYPGPKPWTREQGILMLADSVEATVRAKAQHGKLIASQGGDNGHSGSGNQTVEDLVNSIIDDRVRSGQLNNTPLTLKDLVLIREAFITSLKSIYHPRVEYARSVVKST